MAVMRTNANTPYSIQCFGSPVTLANRLCSSPSRGICVIPLQDVLQLGSEARMNVPSAGSGNWTWRYGLDALQPGFAVQLAKLMEMTDRDGYEAPIEGSEAGRPTDEASKRVELGAEK